MASVELLWDFPPPNVALADGGAHVWCIKLDLPRARADELFQLLSADEQHRAGQFRFDDKRRHYVAGRATLRRLLGGYLKVDPSTLAFHYGPRGKPELAGSFAGQLHFNVSHSGPLGLIALTRMGPIGVDLEPVRALRYTIEIARRFFTARESAALESLPEAGRAAAFFSLWTRKEAWLKAAGLGIPECFGRVEISFLPGEPARVLTVADDAEEAGKWTLLDLKPAKDFIGALAIRARGLNVHCWRWVE